MEPGDPDILKRKPRDPKAGILDKAFVSQITIQGLLISISVIAAFLIGLKDSPAVATTMAFSTLTFARLLHGFNCRSQHSIFKIGFKNNWYSLAAFAVGTILLALILFVPALHSLFAVTPLTGQEVMWLAGLALIPTILIQAVKMIRK